MLDILAEVVVNGGGYADEMGESPRQLGYLAALVKGAPCDPHNRLDAFSRACLQLVSKEPVVETAARDDVQRRWGAPWHMDAAKLRRELPLHVQRKQRAVT